MDVINVLHGLYRCTACFSHNVQTYCEFCHKAYCKICIRNHTVDDEHKIVPFTGENEYLIYTRCGKHQHKYCEFQCYKCKTPVCFACIASGQHREHTVTYIHQTNKRAKNSEIPLPFEEIAYEWYREVHKMEKVKYDIARNKKNSTEMFEEYVSTIGEIQSLLKTTFVTLKEIGNSQESLQVNSVYKSSTKTPTMRQQPIQTSNRSPTDDEPIYVELGKCALLTTDVDRSRDLLDEPELINTIQTEETALANIACLDKDRFWASGPSNTIFCFNIKGHILKTIKTRSGLFPGDIAVDSNENLLYTDLRIGSVYKVNDDSTEELIRLTHWNPYKLCLTYSGDILITMFNNEISQSKIVRYTGSTEKQTIQFDEKGKPLFSGNDLRKSITENINRDICVADWGAGAVVVVNSSGKLQWRYHGCSTVFKKDNINPIDIGTDTRGHILTTDSQNQCIHILDQTGKFLRFIDNCDLRYPTGLCVDKNDYLFVLEYEKECLKKIRYTY